jgi:heptosyltransferase I
VHRSSLSETELLAQLGRDARNVCVVLLTGLGDVVHGLPVVTALKRALPGRRISWVVEPAPAALLAGHRAIDDVIVFRKTEGIRGVHALKRDLRQRSFDLTLNLNIYFKSIFPTLLSRAPHRLGFDRQRARDGVWLASNHHLRPGQRKHTQDLFLEFLERLDIPAGPLDWALELSADEHAVRDRVAENRSRPVVALVPASANAKKDWLPDRYAQLGDALQADYGVDVMLLGGPGTRETLLARQIEAAMSHKPIWGMGDGVRRVLTLISSSRLVIAPDTGPVHMARALGVPVIGLYGHTNPWRVGPYRAYDDLWVDAYTNPDEAPDAARAEPRLGRMERITVQDVLTRVERALAPQTTHFR